MTTEKTLKNKGYKRNKKMKKQTKKEWTALEIHDIKKDIWKKAYVEYSSKNSFKNFSKYCNFIFNILRDILIDTKQVRKETLEEVEKWANDNESPMDNSGTRVVALESLLKKIKEMKEK
jgi:hypothetical protein